MVSRRSGHPARARWVTPRSERGARLSRAGERAVGGPGSNLWAPWISERSSEVAWRWNGAAVLRRKQTARSSYDACPISAAEALDLGERLGAQHAQRSDDPTKEAAILLAKTLPDERLAARMRSLDIISDSH